MFLYLEKRGKKTKHGKKERRKKEEEKKTKGQKECSLECLKVLMKGVIIIERNPYIMGADEKRGKKNEQNSFDRPSLHEPHSLEGWGRGEIS